MLWRSTYSIGFHDRDGSGTDGLPLHEIFGWYCLVTLTAYRLSYGLSKLASARGRLLRLMILKIAVVCANIANLSVIHFHDVH